MWAGFVPLPSKAMAIASTAALKSRQLFARVYFVYFI
jgi:hypothetical protein